MKSRRQFVMEGTLAATALIASQSFKTLASITTPFTNAANAGFSHNSHVIFLHAAELHHAEIIGDFKRIKTAVPNSILIDSGEKETSNMAFDISANDNAELFNKNNYHIITKGKIKTGIIFAKPTDEEVIAKVENTAAFLKNEKKCSIVVCISHLGHRQENSIDDLTLASQSKNIDVIMNGHESNFKSRTMIACNSLSNEVIIQSSKSHMDAYGKFEIGFDENGTKKHIHLATKLYKDICTA